MNEQQSLYTKLGIAAFVLLLQVACGGGPSPATEFALAEVGPIPEAKNQPIDQFVRMEFNQAIDANSLSEDDFGFFDITHLDESEDLVTAIPFRIELSANPSVVFLHPEIELPKNATLFVGVTDGFKASSGSETKDVSGFRFYTVRDDTAPQILAANADETNDLIDVSSNFEFIYDEELFSTQTEYLTKKFLEEQVHGSNDWSLAEHLETLVSVEGNSVTLTPSSALNYDSKYKIWVSGFGFEDQHGNRERNEYKQYQYSTKPYPVVEDLPFSIDYKIFDKNSNAIIGINYQQNELIKISLSGELVATTHSLPDVLNKFCLHESSSRVFATFHNSDVIRAYDVETMQETDVITWAPRELTEYNQDKVLEFGDFNIYTRKGVYNLDGFERIHRSIVPQTDLAEFDLHGNLILIDNDALKLYKIDENILSTGDFP